MLVFSAVRYFQIPICSTIRQRLPSDLIFNRLPGVDEEIRFALPGTSVWPRSSVILCASVTSIV